ncbi:Adenylate cyclase type 10-like Protein [Tribolium castaneum]|uniref:Adenylate cyclase type 10-like Protein n=1 Tax=Tribolium castaneum TaxID=7070 RepID=A0A139WH49_TRICA|nr:PREDICTED: adenylate cyclase type 10 isoform X2 [Tribolium castaneum]KYB27283.1 Adenylate cyclase type 10-like Protein [Tribolium castaneum]|eukprot:XP_015836166.1 PREDICTED: adenylate cyclase type 10 isoform X2 [Tribolium castaneum]
MMEGLNQLGQEEYIWAMRTSGRRDSDVEVRKAGRSYQSGLLGKKSKSVVESTDDRQTKVMASLVPDEVIYNVDDYTHRKYDACFLFGDVSGFTELCEKYTKTGVAGPSRMTQVLNKYLGSMVQEVMSHNGDVLKFSGDAFLAIFKTSDTETMRDAVHEALDCALVIQKNYGSYMTDVGVAIRAISAGLVTFALIGDSTNSHYVVVGQPIWDVKAAESISSAGDIVVAPAAWHFVNPNEYLSEEMSDNIHVKIVGVGPNWRSVQKNLRQQKPDDETGEDVVSQDEESTESDVLSEITQDGALDEFSLRPAVNLAVRLHIKEALRRFIIAPVMKSIDMDEPFEYLTEMRQAVIVFINVITYKLETEKTVILADQTYKTVCRVVDKMKGCVNKVSLFDKDLMFVVIFGLRGLKHELECQVALRCARQCHTAIDKLPGVMSTSIGVTTGKTYCGVFGHTLRREYTVISLIVNKAARLMVAYEGKVTCDRETFLHSKLESRHFILQPHKYLKGISHPGPVYEFREVEIDHDHVNKVNACPLLGRERNIKLYKQLLDKCLHSTDSNEPQYKMLLISGDARQGKTRLLDELVYLTPSEIPVSKVVLTELDQNIPYQCVKLIFGPPLLISKSSTSHKKQQVIQDKLNKIQVPELMCVLNNVFDVNFKVSDLYMSLKVQARKIALVKMIKQLCYACFTTVWVVAIDNLDFMDAESSSLFDCFFDIKTIFIAATRGRERLLQEVMSQKIVEDPRVKHVQLLPIERWYLGALACQILGVYAMSPELENAIQVRSNGNPGWVESFLISLIQDEGLYILKATLKDINDLGLVCPPLYMMARLTKDQMRKWQHIMEERRPSIDSISAEEDNWKRYIDSCRDSHLNVTVREEMEAISRGGKVPICIISPTFHVADEEMELSMDAMILKTFDSLNFYEQLLVKCSATLGNQFLRDMLLYVMSATEKRKAALAVQKLFEIRVLSCAKGDFMEGGTKIFKEKLLDPDDEMRLKCDCRGIKIEEECKDLPKYASCGYLQFRSSLFRDITYNLLTDNQKKEFHQRAIRFLERETRKCQACGGGFFHRILGAHHDKEFIRARDKQKKTFSGVTSWEGVSHRTSMHSMSIRSESHFSAHSQSYQSFHSKRSRFDSVAGGSMGSMPSQIFGEIKEDKSYDAFFGFSIINKLKNSFSLTKAFSSEDFTDCQCNLILSTTYAQLIEHCKGAGDLGKEIEALLEYAQICIIASNLPLAMSILDESLDVLREKAKERAENIWKVALIRAKIYCLIGYSRLELGHLDEALLSLNLSLNEYGITFPKGINKHLKLYAHKVKQLFGLYLFPKSLTKNLDHWETIFANNLAECLSHFCTLFMIKKEWKNAEMAAVWGLTKSLESFSDFRVICSACANMIHVAQYFHNWSLCVALEVHALRLCHLKRASIEAEDIKCVCKLYCVIFVSRVFMANLDKAIHLGYIVLRLCSSVHAVRVILPLLPTLIQCLIMGKHFANAYSVLQELKLFAEDDTDNSGKIWYYAICVGLQLETGYTLVPYHICEHFYQLEGENWVNIRDSDARRRFFTVMWLWCIRNEKWEAAYIWCYKTSDFMSVSEKDSLANKITSLYVLEGLLLYFVNKLDKRNIKAIIRVEHEINSLFKTIEKISKTVKVLIPRLYHLKAYYKYIKMSDSNAIDMLTKASNYAHKYGNSLEEGWIDHSVKAWNKTLQANAIEFWKEHSEAENVLDFQDIEITGETLGYYTLPTPLYE